MDEFDAGTTRRRADARAAWMHRLRNAVNNAGVGVTFGRRLLARGDIDGAAEMLGHAEAAWAECRELLRDPDAPLVREGTLVRPPAGASTPQTATRPRQ